MVTGELRNKIDALWDAFEYLLSKIAQSGLNGQFRTPRHIIRMMVELMEPSSEDVICDIKTTRLIRKQGQSLKSA